MDIALIVTIIGVGVGIVGSLFGFALFFINRLDAYETRRQTALDEADRRHTQANRDLEEELSDEIERVRGDVQGLERRFVDLLGELRENIARDYCRNAEISTLQAMIKRLFEKADEQTTNVNRIIGLLEGGKCPAISGEGAPPAS